VTHEGGNGLSTVIGHKFCYLGCALSVSDPLKLDTVDRPSQWSASMAASARLRV